MLFSLQYQNLWHKVKYGVKFQRVQLDAGAVCILYKNCALAWKEFHEALILCLINGICIVEQDLFLFLKKSFYFIFIVREKFFLMFKNFKEYNKGGGYIFLIQHLHKKLIFAFHLKMSHRNPKLPQGGQFGPLSSHLQRPSLQTLIIDSYCCR